MALLGCRRSAFEPEDLAARWTKSAAEMAEAIRSAAESATVISRARRLRFDLGEFGSGWFGWSEAEDWVGPG